MEGRPSRKRIGLIATGLLLSIVLVSAPACVKKKPRTEHPAKSPSKKGYVETGEASWYGKKFQGKKTASGERFDMYALTAAHRTLPFGTKVKVTNLENKKTVVVRINDRGPWAKGRIIDLSFAAAKKIGMIEKGVAKVRIEVL